MFATPKHDDSADQLREAGNKAYAQNDFPAALSNYSRAIMKSPQNVKLFTNRALVYLKMNMYDRVVSDCEKAIELEATNVKAHYMLGQALCEIGHEQEAVKKLKKAIQLEQEQNHNFGTELQTALGKAERKLFERKEEERLTQVNELEILLNQLLRNHGKSILAERQHSGTKEEVDEEIASELMRRQKELDDLFSNFHDARRRRCIPEPFLCKISMEIMREPVITPSGITYDRACIKEHFRRLGFFDPTTRKPITEKDLIPNLALADSIEAFLKLNPWAEFS